MQIKSVSSRHPGEKPPKKSKTIIIVTTILKMQYLSKAKLKDIRNTCKYRALTLENSFPKRD